MNSKLFLLVIVFIAVLVKTENVQRHGKDFQGYFPSEEEKKWDYQIFQYPSGYYPIKEECEKNPMIPLLGKGLNFLLLKLGIVGVVKAIAALLVLGFLVKLPLIFLKFAFLKSFFLPFLLAPFVFSLLSSQMGSTSGGGGGGGTMEEKPGETPSVTEEIMGMNDMNIGMGRQLAGNLTSVAWESVKMFAESDQCVERISCLIGATNNDSSVGRVFSRMLKFLHYSSPPVLQNRMNLIREAFDKGTETSACTNDDYKCESPELLIQHGLTKVKIL